MRIKKSSSILQETTACSNYVGARVFLAESYPKNSKRWSLPSCECVPIRSSWSCVLNKRATGARTRRAKTGRWALRHARSSSRCSSNWSEITARCSSPRRSVRIRAKFGTDFGVNIIHELKTYMCISIFFGHRTVIFCASLSSFVIVVVVSRFSCRGYKQILLGVLIWSLTPRGLKRARLLPRTQVTWLWLWTASPTVRWKICWVWRTKCCRTRICTTCRPTRSSYEYRLSCGLDSSKSAPNAVAESWILRNLKCNHLKTILYQVLAFQWARTFSLFAARWCSYDESTRSTCSPLYADRADMEEYLVEYQVGYKTITKWYHRQFWETAEKR